MNKSSPGVAMAMVKESKVCTTPLDSGAAGNAAARQGKERIGRSRRKKKKKEREKEKEKKKKKKKKKEGNEG